jgi:hypothetical protein
MTLKGRCFNDVEEIQAESQAALNAVQKSSRNVSRSGKIAGLAV